MNYLFLDGESTGLNSDHHSLVQLACIAVIDGEIKESFNEYCQPHRYDNIEQEAVNVHGITPDRMRTFQTQEEMLAKFIPYVESFGVKFTIAGYNVGFDKKFIASLFTRNKKSHEFTKFFNFDIYDVYFKAKKVQSQLLVKNCKLVTLAEHFGIEINAHDALSDIRATIILNDKLSVMLGENTTIYKATKIDVPVNLPEPAQLHLNSQYNMVDAIPTPDEWSKWCLKNKVPGFSVVDAGSAVSLYYAAHPKNKETTCVPGLGLNVKFNAEDNGYFTLSAWAISNVGYYNLMALSSLAFNTVVTINKADIPLLTIEQIKERSEGLIFGLSGISGAVGSAVALGHEQLATEKFLWLLGEFGDKLFAELCPVDITYIYDKGVGFKRCNNNALVVDGNLQKAYNQFIWKLAVPYGVKCLPISNAKFISPDDKILQDCVCKNSNSDGAHYHESYHARLSDDIYSGLKAHLGDLITVDQYKQMVQNTLDIVERAKSIKIDLKYHLPKIEIPEDIQQQTDDYDMQTYLVLLRKIKEHGRWNNSPEYKERFQKEIDVIKNNSAMNFIPYFLVYEDMGTFARNSGFMQNIARGSAGGSLISYYLKIIHVDPVKANLPFERFLSHARIRAGSWPDIDMDIAKDARPYLMKYLQEKYQSGFAQVATFSTMKTKNAIKDAMSALYGRNRTDPEIDAVCKSIPDSPQGVEEFKFLYGYTDQEGTYHVGQYDENEMLRNFFAAYPDIESIVKRLIGVVRGWSRHASAFVIATESLPEQRVPTMQMFDNGLNDYIAVTQYDAKMVEGSGLVKADILGLKTLSVVTDCLKSVKSTCDYLAEENGLALIYRLPEDEAVYTDFYNKKTDSSFQFNTPIIKDCLQDYCATKRTDLYDLTALKRPGAMDALIDGITADKYYTLVKNGQLDARYIHEDLRSILEETNGVFVYQESVMKCLVDICGYSWEETDQIRSAIAKKKQEVIMAAFDRIRDATAQRGWTREQADELCQSIQAFSRYSFNRSHSYAYGEMGYITMYLKRKHPLQWWTAVLNNEDDEDKIRYYVSLLGDTILPPVLHEPSENFVIRGNKIVAPISVIKGIGPKAVQEICAKGPFTSLEDFCARVDHRKFDIGCVSQALIARAANFFLNPELSEYDAVIDFTERFKAIRKTKSKFKEELFEKDSLQRFINERSANKVFNKTILAEAPIRAAILAAMPGLQVTSNKGAPFLMSETPVINGVKVADSFLANNYAGDVGIIALCVESNVISGTSKKTGKPYAFLSIRLSDGYMDLEAVDFNKSKPLRFPQNCIVYIKGVIEKGWSTSVRIKVKEIDRII